MTSPNLAAQLPKPLVGIFEMMTRRPGDLPENEDSLLPPGAVIAIDGPAGSGKSTTARNLAERFGLLYIDTGAMYRSLTLASLLENIPAHDEISLANLLDEAELELRWTKGEVKVLWNGKDVSRDIRTPQVEALVSQVAAHPAVRKKMVARQQNMGRSGGVVMEGRDIGSVVFPLATAKIYLSANLEARVERRYQQYKQRGRKISRAELSRDLADRDRQDSQREISPLCICPDAFVVDSSEMTLAQQNEACGRACLVNPALDQEVDTELEGALRELPARYRFAYFIMRGVSRFYGLKQYGNEGRALPRGCIIAVNHVSMWDPPFVGSTFHRYPVNTLAKAELFKYWPLGPIFRWVDAIPINRHGYDAAAFDGAKTALDAGNNLLIFPEGTRRAIGHPGPVRKGLGIVVQTTRAPMVPVFIRGSYGKHPGGSLHSPLEINYGPVMRWHGLDALLTKENAADVSCVIGDLCEAAFRELQTRSYARTPQSAFEAHLGQRQLKRFAERQSEVFRS